MLRPPLDQPFAQCLKTPGRIYGLTIIQIRPRQVIITVRLERMIRWNLRERLFGLIEATGLIVDDPQLQARTGQMRASRALRIQKLIGHNRLLRIRLFQFRIRNTRVVQSHISI